jgi:hypothetical protein
MKITVNAMVNNHDTILDEGQQGDLKQDGQQVTECN